MDKTDIQKLNIFTTSSYAVKNILINNLFPIDNPIRSKVFIESVDYNKEALGKRIAKGNSVGKKFSTNNIIFYMFPTGKNNKKYCINDQTIINRIDDNFVIIDFSKDPIDKKIAKDLLEEKSNTYEIESGATNVKNNTIVVYDKDNPGGLNCQNFNAVKDYLLKKEIRKYNKEVITLNLQDNMYDNNGLLTYINLGLNKNDNTISQNQLQSYLEAMTKHFSNNTQISVIDIGNFMEKKPFGFSPNKACAYIVARFLHKYVNENYYGSNGTITEIANVNIVSNMLLRILVAKQRGITSLDKEYIVKINPKKQKFYTEIKKDINLDFLPKNTEDFARSLRDRIERARFPLGVGQDNKTVNLVYKLISIDNQSMYKIYAIEDEIVQSYKKEEFIKLFNDEILQEKMEEFLISKCKYSKKRAIKKINNILSDDLISNSGKGIGQPDEFINE